MLKFTNTKKTAAVFNGAYFTLSSPEEWDSIGDCPTRTAVKEWLAEGNTPEPADPEPTPPAPVDPVQKLREFLADNPDVAAIL